jgi:C4-dicarboxylate-specific signal transduction histidine kinase
MIAWGEIRKQTIRRKQAKMEKILYVDDEENILRAFRREYRQKFELVTAASAEEGLAAIATQGPFAVIISDFRMPKADGNYFLAAAKEAAPDSVRIMLSGYADVDMAMQAINEGNVFRFLTKPCPSETMDQVLELAVRQYKLVMAEHQLKESEQQLRAANQHLEEARKETELLNRTLEERVEERTRELQESTMQLIQAEKLVAIGELAASVAHELKQPLNTIKIIGQSILRDIEKKRFEEQSAKEDLPEIINQVNKMSEIIDHMRVFARRPIEGASERVDLNLVIDNALKFVAQQLKNHSIEIVMNLAADLPNVLGDSVRLEQVIVNLINNARHAVEKNNKEQKLIEVRTGKGDDGQTVLLEVKDNGIGITEEAKKKIFQPFFTTKEPGKGTGLGLSVSKKIIEEHKGTLDFFSNVGEGTVFRFVLPSAS